MITKIVSFAEIIGRFDLAPEKAIEYFTSKGLRPTFSWLDMIGEEHDAAFTVAKMMDADLLKTVQERLTLALEQGSTLEDFKRELIPTLQESGWWGKKDVIDPKTGLVIKAQLGSASRLETIFRSNLQSAYAVGRWDMIERNKQYAPYLMYDAVDDNRTRAAHAKLDEVVRPVDDAFWSSHYPPLGYNCRCSVVQMSAEDLSGYGLKVSPPQKVKTRMWRNPRTGLKRPVPEGVDPGWDNNPAKARQTTLQQVKADKLAQLPIAARKAYSVAESAAQAVRKRFMAQVAIALTAISHLFDPDDVE